MSRSNDLASLADEATGGITKAEVGLGNVDNTADSAKPVSTAQQTALDAKANKSGDIFSGNVGIGASSLTGGNVGLDIHKTGSGVGSQIRLKNQHNTGFYIGQAGDTTGEVIVWNDANTDMQFRTNGDERLRIKANGNIGIATGSNTLTEKLRVDGAVAITGQLQSHQTSAMALHQTSSTISEIRVYGADASTAGTFRIRGYANDGSPFYEGLAIDSSGTVSYTHLRAHET